ncbi:unnamed protein product [Cylindrotheca closterium]|uniref:Phosphodiesterase n=1 Tax=Cylindrotheca closterium TaxID=2856 RepID=A0AAD2FQA5_9STRA|nr:unnamed protein product [Cylindrotheca closterium]
MFTKSARNHKITSSRQPQRLTMRLLGKISNHDLLDTDEESQCLNRGFLEPSPPPSLLPSKEPGFGVDRRELTSARTSVSTPPVGDDDSSLSLTQTDSPIFAFQEEEGGEEEEASTSAPSTTTLKKAISESFQQAKAYSYKQLLAPGLIVLISIAIGVFLKLATEQAETRLREKVFENQAKLLSALWQARLKETVGHSGIIWESVFDQSPIVTPMIVVMNNSCKENALTFQVGQTKAAFLGIGELHNPDLSDYGQCFGLPKYTKGSDLISQCENIAAIYPTKETVSHFSTNQSDIAMASFFIFAAILTAFIICHDYFLRKQIERLSNNFHQAQEIVSSLFPANVQERLFQMHSEPSVRLDDMMLTPKTTHKSTPERVQLELTMEESASSFHCEAPPPPPQVDTLESFDLVEEVELANKVLESKKSGGSERSKRSGTPSQKLQMFLSPPQLVSGVSEKIKCVKNEPIADLFPMVSVMFADIAGFTAWSSEREPAQVFRLLETIFHCFDKLANEYNVFKVETIGDCYVAVTGLPERRDDHAVAMARFAHECLTQMNNLTRKLELVLGPGTAELRMRFGIPSGPVTAGVLRGAKSRFQLFGDTVNFASRMESTGRKNRIQVSQATANHLNAAGLESWLYPRGDLVYAKGKGDVRTFWLDRPSTSARSVVDSSTGDSNSDFNLNKAGSTSTLIELKSKSKSVLIRGLSFQPNRDEPSHISDKLNERRDKLSASIHSNNKWNQVNEKYDSVREQLALEEAISGEFSDVGRQLRLIDWNSEILSKLLKKIVAVRQTQCSNQCCEDVDPRSYSEPKYLEEVREIIPLLSEEDMSKENWMDVEKLTNIDIHGIELPPNAERQLKEYVTTIACMYRSNAFHNFEHASHVLMNSLKLLNRVIATDQLLLRIDYTCAISSDPLTQFAIVFAALIHDVDHTGVTNSQLVKESAHIASLYNNKSVAEQNSLDLAWELLMEPSYKDFRPCIFSTKSELQRFRQLIVNVILATDIFDSDMKALRNSRFSKAFHMESEGTSLTTENELNLKATIVIEYIMQASDVSHTMQHWHVYKKWNEHLFAEMYSAWQVGRLGFNPSTGWFQGELSFFDNYIIPLAKKLEDCQVFGAAGNELLKFALENRKEWEKKGKELVAAYIQKYTSESE